MKNKVVVFTSNNARVLTNPRDLEKYKEYHKAVVNPDMRKVMYVPPHYWKRKGNEIVPMNRAERLSRDQHIKLMGANNKLPQFKKSRAMYWLLLLAGLAAGGYYLWLM